MTDPTIAATAVRVGDGDLLAELFREHYPSLLRLALLLVDSRAAAEDVVQEAFVRVEGVLRRRGGEVGLAYVRQAVVNISRSDLRRRLVALRHAPRSYPDAPGADEGALAALERDDLVRALRTLPRRQREAVVLRHCSDLTEAATASLLGISTGAVKAYTSRGLTALRTAMGDQA
jgi:RNA polymerase sigma-70 factor (sigma-E family)